MHRLERPSPRFANTLMRVIASDGRASVFGRITVSGGDPRIMQFGIKDGF
jgi:hypothetical protein